MKGWHVGVAALVLFAGCSDAASNERLAAAELAALDRLAELSPPPAAGDTEADGSITHDHAEPITLVATLSPAEAQRFGDEWRQATGAARQWPTPADAAADGYAKASSHAPGVGAHWVRWSLVDRPFDPTQPAMLLYDQRPDRRAGTVRLAGFSYWVRSTTEPEGFTGPNDHWHRHSGMCFEDGWLAREGVEPSACSGQWLNGSDLWMLHAWVVPELASRHGVFSPHNENLCPPNLAPGPDWSKCLPVGNPSIGGHGDTTVIEPQGVSIYCHLGTDQTTSAVSAK